MVFRRRMFRRRNGFSSFRRFKRRSTRGTSFAKIRRSITKGTGKWGANSSRLWFSSALRSRQPVPDEYITDIRINNQGYIASGPVGGTFGFSLNWPWHPFNRSGVVSAGLPNAVVAVGTAQSNSLPNLLFNTTTGTGLWENGMVDHAEVEIGCYVTSISDTIRFAMAPISSNTPVNYANIVQMVQSPNAVEAVSTYATPKKLRRIWAMNALQGIPINLWPSQYIVSTFTAATGPAPEWFVSFRALTMDQAALGNSLNITVSVRYRCRFFSRVDVALLDV